MVRLLIDTDPGIDDALALFFAAVLPEIEIAAVTTVSGNLPVALTTRNALALLALAGRSDVAVVRGCDRPLLRPPVYAGHVHGEHGLGGVVLPDAARQPDDGYAVTAIIQQILQAPGEISLVALGPLTNFALAVRCEPRIAEQVREVVIMGGALRVPGNVSPSAEFNIFADPHAAQIVMHAGWPVRLVSLDVTQSTVLDRQQFVAIAACGHPVARCIKTMTDFYLDRCAALHRVVAFPMHDPLCLAAAVYPDLITWEKAYVDIEINGTSTQGATVAYFEQMRNADPALAHLPAPNVLASVDVDRQRFVDLYTKTIALY